MTVLHRLKNQNITYYIPRHVQLSIIKLKWLRHVAFIVHGMNIVLKDSSLGSLISIS